MNSHSSTITDDEIAQLPPPPREWLEDIEREEQEIKTDFYYNYDELWNIILKEKERLEDIDEAKVQGVIDVITRTFYNHVGIKKSILSYDKAKKIPNYRKLKKDELCKTLIDIFKNLIVKQFRKEKKELTIESFNIFIKYEWTLKIRKERWNGTSFPYGGLIHKVIDYTFFKSFNY